MEEVVVTETSRPLRMGVKAERRGSALCRIESIYTVRTDQAVGGAPRLTSGTPDSAAATRLWSLRPAYLRR